MFRKTLRFLIWFPIQLFLILTVGTAFLLRYLLFVIKQKSIFTNWFGINMYCLLDFISFNNKMWVVHYDINSGKKRKYRPFNKNSDGYFFFKHKKDFFNPYEYYSITKWTNKKKRELLN